MRVVGNMFSDKGTLVKTVMNLRVVYILPGNTLDWQSVSFTRRIVLHGSTGSTSMLNFT
jgi:hypothetical protein